MSEHMFKYRIKCLDENRHYELWSMTPPTTCPFSHSHVIDSSNIELLQKQTQEAAQTNIVKVYEDENGTQAQFRSESFKFALTPGISRHKISFQYPVSIILSKCNFRELHVNDIINAYVTPNVSEVGTLAFAAPAGSTQVFLPNHVISTIARGFNLILNGQNVGEIKRVFTTYVELVTPLSTNYPVGTPMTFQNYVIKNYIIDVNGHSSIGESKIGASYLPVEACIYVEYNNASLTSKDLVFSLEYLY